MKNLFVYLFLLLISISSQGQKKQVDPTAFTKQGGNPGFLNALMPNFVRWTDDSHFLMSKRPHADSLSTRLYWVDAKTGKEELAPADMSLRNPVSKKTVTVKRDDIFLRDGSKETQLTKTKEKEINPVFSPDSNYIAFTRNNNLYTFQLATGKEMQLTFDGTDVIMNGYASWVYMEEILGRATNYRAFWWSPDSKHLAFFRSDDTNVPEFVITDGNGQHGYVEKQRYPKAGDPNPKVKVGIVSPYGGNVVWSAFNENDDQYFGKPYWRPDGKALWVQWMNRGQDNLKIYEVNISEGLKQEIYSENQKTWISLDDDDRLEFLKDNKGFLLMSDQTGWRHIYWYDMNGKLINQVTSGSYTVKEIRYIDEKNQFIYFLSKKENNLRNDLYRVNFNGKNLQRLTFDGYNHEVNLSPNGSYFVTKYSNVSTPDKLSLVDNKGKIVRELGDSKGVEFDNYEFPKLQIIRVKSEDGKYDLPMKVVFPSNMVAGKKYPVIVPVYGGPNAGNITDNWIRPTGGGVKDGDMEAIYVYMDHRGSGEFGKEGQNYMHRNLGYWEIKDWTQCIKWLIKNAQADSTRVIISGYSYGGYMTCYALTYGADYFTHGIAGGSVTDWSLYDSHYTERYMDSPKENPEGYKNSAVLTHADKLRGKLMIIHGVIDDNVHVQNSLQLIGKLQDLNKDFEMMLYPGNRHGVFGPKLSHYNKLAEKVRKQYLEVKTF